MASTMKPRRPRKLHEFRSFAEAAAFLEQRAAELKQFSDACKEHRIKVYIQESYWCPSWKRGEHCGAEKKVKERD